ncbi:MAG: AAA family ATPase [Bacteroidales bacterium]|nr:AAA family ATPase [Bacteroidales bacterium]
MAVPSVEDSVTRLILSRFPYAPTNGQRAACAAMAHFLFNQNPRSLFLLKGYAGTGKTSIVSALIQSLEYMRVKPLLMAPTGRAAKVLSNYSAHVAHTIHKRIYVTMRDATGRLHTARAVNKHTHTLFIVDEASMIGLENETSRHSLLDDLINYVYSGQHCRLMLIGDSAQLPPVGQSESAALDETYLQSAFEVEVTSHELTEVVRQHKTSGILYNATALRNQIATMHVSDEATMPLFHTGGFTDIRSISGSELSEVLYDEYSRCTPDEVAIVCRSNKRANLFNQGIRNTILFREQEVNAGDNLMVVKNNYYWLDEKSTIGFVANGDIVEVQSVRNVEELYGFRFADATLRFVDYTDEPPLDCKLLLYTLTAEAPALTAEQSNTLFNNIMQDYAEISSQAERMNEMRRNPYFNALQVKFSYALTCHKTQGGQWRSIVIDQGYIPDLIYDRDYLRWLYTAVTRATEHVYLLDFTPDTLAE